jgi:hypothetical protein
VLKYLDLLVSFSWLLKPFLRNPSSTDAFHPPIIFRATYGVTLKITKNILNTPRKE